MGEYSDEGKRSTVKTTALGTQQSGVLEDIAALASEVVVGSRSYNFSRRLLECSSRARECLPAAQDSLESAMRSYRWALLERSRPYSIGAMVSRVGRVIGVFDRSTIDDLYVLQSDCFSYMIEMIDELAVEAASQEARITSDRDRLADWVVRAESSIDQANAGSGHGGGGGREHSLIKRIQQERVSKTHRSERLAVKQVEIVCNSRRELLPAIQRYAVIIEGIAETVLTLKAHAIAAAEYFEMTFEPARFLDSASDAMPCLERGLKGMAGYHDALRKSVSVCVDKLGGLKDAMGATWRR